MCFDDTIKQDFDIKHTPLTGTAVSICGNIFGGAATDGRSTSLLSKSDKLHLRCRFKIIAIVHTIVIL